MGYTQKSCGNKELSVKTGNIAIRQVMNRMFDSVITAQCPIAWLCSLSSCYFMSNIHKLLNQHLPELERALYATFAPKLHRVDCLVE